MLLLCSRSYSEVWIFKAQQNVSEFWQVPSESLHWAVLLNCEGNPQLKADYLFVFQHRLVALLQWAMEAADSSTACCRWQPNVNRSWDCLEQARGVFFCFLFFSCCKGVWCLLPATQPCQFQLTLPEQLWWGQVVKILAFVSWNNVVRVRRPFLTLFHYPVPQQMNFFMT